MLKGQLLQKINEKSMVCGVVGLGYVGLPLAVEKAKAGFRTIGFDVQTAKVDLVNAGKNYIGDVVDNEALIQALKSKTIAGAGLDVYEGEPKLDPGFLELDNAVLLPHLGSATTETRVAMGMKVIDNVEAFFEGLAPPNRVV